MAGQVLCQRMLIGPCARTMVGAATVAAAPVAAAFRKRRRVDAPSLLVFVMMSSLSAIRDGSPLFCKEKTRTCAGLWQESFRTMRRYDADGVQDAANSPVRIIPRLSD
ncbi:hypothetical protein [Bradyrhizobium huanghuaihaiense]